MSITLYLCIILKLGVHFVSLLSGGRIGAIIDVFVCWVFRSYQMLLAYKNLSTIPHILSKILDLPLLPVVAFPAHSCPVRLQWPLVVCEPSDRHPWTSSFCPTAQLPSSAPAWNSRSLCQSWKVTRAVSVKQMKRLQLNALKSRTSIHWIFHYQHYLYLCPIFCPPLLLT